MAPNNRLAVGLVARVGMFAGMLMTLRTVGLLFFYGRWGEGIVARVLLGILLGRFGGLRARRGGGCWS